MGAVSLVVREEGAFRRVYAVKRLHPEFRRDEHVRSMFMDEARIAGLLHHANVVSVVDVGEDEDGPYLVMDYVQGVPLAVLIAAAREDGKLIPVQICARIIKDIAEGLDAAHELVGHDGERLELVHRDVSPQNVLVGFDGVARLTDFGIAKALGRQQRTGTGILKGKFGYLAPERLQFEHPTKLSDIFSLGVVLYEALSARRLYDGNDQTDIARSILKDPPPDIAHVRTDVHPMIIEILFQMLAKDPTKRPQSAREVARRLDAILVYVANQEGPSSVSDYVIERFDEVYEQQKEELEDLTAAVALHRVSTRPPWFRRHRRGFGAALLAAVIAVAIGAWSMIDQEEDFGSVAVAETVTAAETVAETEVVAETETETVAEAEAEADAETETKPVKRTRRVRRKPKGPASDTPSATEGLWKW